MIFTIFDEDGDGALSNKEFVAVMKNKLKRGLEKPKDTGLFNFLTAVAKCAKLTPKTVTEAVARETFPSMDVGGGVVAKMHFFC